MTPAPELAIRLARASFNRALDAADLAAIGPLLAPDAVLVAGTDSALIVGRKAQLAAWKREFAARDRTLYTRTPQAITVSPIGGIAFEHGEWRASRHRPATRWQAAATLPNGGSSIRPGRSRRNSS
jgi:ketosteroid isomerase-like protein